TGLSQSTNAAGHATVGSWTLGATSGSNTLTASATGLTGSPLTFHATGVADTANSMAVSAGDNQSATVHTNVATAPAVVITDQHGNPVQGVAVTFAVASGGGSATGTSTTTNASGVAAVGSWKLGTGAGTTASPRAQRDSLTSPSTRRARQMRPRRSPSRPATTRARPSTRTSRPRRRCSSPTSTATPSPASRSRSRSAPAAGR